MAPAYQNVSSGQVVISDDPRPDLAVLARWRQVPVPATPSPSDEELAAAARAAENPTGDGGSGQAQTSDGDQKDAVDAPADGVEREHTLDDAAPAPTVEWTHEQLDAYAAERGTKFPANTNKAEKVAVLTKSAE
jgi:hypothetical protein